jgi:hypothetical protein
VRFEEEIVSGIGYSKGEDGVEQDPKLRDSASAGDGLLRF